MTFNFDNYKPLIAQLEKIGLPILTPIVTAAAAGVAGPLGLAAPMVLSGIVGAINAALGIGDDATPQQAADAIAADPDAAKDKLAAIQEDHSYLLAAAKQADDARITSQAQQTALLALDAASESRIQRLWRPAIGWGLGALMMLSFGLPFVVWAFLVGDVRLPPPPVLDERAIMLLGALLGVNVVSRSADKGVRANAVKAVVAAPKRR